MTDSTGKKLVKLPAISFYLHKVKLSPAARALYDEVAAELKIIVAKYLKAGTTSTHYSHVRKRRCQCVPSVYVSHGNLQSFSSYAFVSSHAIPPCVPRAF